MPASLIQGTEVNSENESRFSLRVAGRADSKATKKDRNIIKGFAFSKEGKG